MRSRDRRTLADDCNPMKRHFLILVVLSMCLGLTTPASAWQEAVQRVEETIADVGPLSVSLRSLSVDLRQPSGFDSVYQLPGKDGKFMRVQGGLYAVFSRSLYKSTKQGKVATIPDGTVFYIGPPSFLRDEANTPAEKPPATAQRQPIHRLEDRLTPPRAYQKSDSPPSHPTRLHRSSGRSEALATVQRQSNNSAQESLESEPPTIINDPSYRETRIHQLMKKAADASNASDD